MGEIIVEVIFRVVLYYIGGTLRWFFATLWSYIFNTPKRPYKQYVYDSSSDLFDDEGTGCLNVIVGIIFIILVVIIIYNI